MNTWCEATENDGRLAEWNIERIPSRDSALSWNALIVNSVIVKVRLSSEHMCGFTENDGWF